MKSKGHTVSFINRFFNSFFSYAFLVMLFAVSFVFNTSSASATSTLTVSIPFDRISLNLVGVNNEPTFAKSNDASFTVSTTNSTGYTVNIKSNTTGGNDGSGVLLLNGNDSNYTISSIGGNDFPVGGINESTYRTSSTYNNTWGYKPSMIDSSSNSNFLPSPDATGDTINVTNCANGTENTTCTSMTDTYSIAIGAKVDSTVRIGSYSNTFVILAVANAIPYTIIYDDNTVTNMPVDVSTTSQADSVNISSNVPVKDGYTFLGWCDTTPTTTNGVDSCPSGSTIYNPNGAGTNLAYTLNRQGGSNNLHLYAMWSKNGGPSTNYVDVTVNFTGDRANDIIKVTFTNASTGTTLTITSSGATIPLLPETTYTITANPSMFFGGWSSTYGTISDSNSYSTTYTTDTNSTISLNAVNATYMQDLTLAQCQKNVGTNGNPANIGDNILVYDKRSNNYPDNESGYTVRYINGYCWMTQNLRITGTISATDSNFTGADFNVSQYDLRIDGDGMCAASGGNGYTHACSRFPDSTEIAVFNRTVENIGGWYNYYAASAGTIANNNNSLATVDICPKNWHLPVGPASNSSSDYAKMIGYNISSYTSLNTNGINAFGVVSSGHYLNGGLYDSGSSWWIANATGDVNGNDRYIFEYRKSDGKFAGNTWDYKYVGNPIRCVRTE